MALYTKHPVAPRPSAPPRETTGHLLVRGVSVLALFGVFAHTAVYNLLGVAGAAVVLGVMTAGVVALWVVAIVRRMPTRLPWRRLPWTALGYVAFALLSLLWSRWPAATALTWVLLAAVTVSALFIATMLTWQEVVRALATTLKLILGLSLAIELWVALVLRHPLLPNFVEKPEGHIDPHLYWVRGNLFDGGQIQGVVGNAHTLAMMCLFALIVFGVLLADRFRGTAKGRRRGALVVWMLLAAVLMVRADSATVYVSAVVAVAVLAAALAMRAATGPGQRRTVYLVVAAVGAAGVLAAWLLRDRLLAILGKGSDLTGRLEIWQRVWQRAQERPVAGHGFSSPWVPWDPAFDGWIEDHGLSVFHAHDMWLDVFLQLGAIGVVLMAVAWLALAWRAWFFAVDRPRWDLDDQRPYATVSLLPTLLVAVLLVEGIAESAPIMLWGWMLLVLLSFKIKTVPLVGVGLSERTPLIGDGTLRPHGAPPRRVP
ncbi:O-antigen ligase family protein [Microbacterium sp. EF45047]|uniref:O-antigen ligase family protein n=1 Tax=Microbacterium sp. EF45047 TaxID=2809708 RepID=UPI00234A2660|nr:O-antigen ligase family protein [Microbacterium sp. EF45047]WCM56367.1 O-antigen ligase family protein [Microbacterium sp. EF45047]